MVNKLIKICQSVFQYLVLNSDIGCEVAVELKMSQEVIQCLVDHNILATHPNGTLTFHDRQVKMWFKKALLDGEGREVGKAG